MKNQELRRPLAGGAPSEPTRLAVAMIEKRRSPRGCTDAASQPVITSANQRLSIRVLAN